VKINSFEANREEFGAARDVLGGRYSVKKTPILIKVDALLKVIYE
jgi:hypothetical protein